MPHCGEHAALPAGQTESAQSAAAVQPSFNRTLSKHTSHASQGLLQAGSSVHAWQAPGSLSVANVQVGLPLESTLASDTLPAPTWQQP